MQTITAEMRQRALELFQKRRQEAAWRWRPIDNGALYAGEPMYFYCEWCGWPSDILHEQYFLANPRSMCSECHTMQLYGIKPHLDVAA